MGRREDRDPGPCSSARWLALHRVLVAATPPRAVVWVTGVAEYLEPDEFDGSDHDSVLPVDAGALKLFDHCLPCPLALFEEHEELGHVLAARSLEELADDVGANPT